MQMDQETPFKKQYEKPEAKRFPAARQRLDARLASTASPDAATLLLAARVAMAEPDLPRAEQMLYAPGVRPVIDDRHVGRRPDQ